jgi:DNA-directed RNA polymerase subunit M/transcription elongation factor TFIIS
MSIESMQFLEMVREAAHLDVSVAKRGRSRSEHVGKVGEGFFCDMCGNKGMMFLRVEERDEIYQCELCGHVRWYRVR